MCKQDNTVPVTVPGKDRPVGVDECIADLVQALNHNGFPTVASCCGHGHRPGSIVLADGREFIIAPDYHSARIAERAFPNIQGNWSSPENKAFADRIRAQFA